MRAILVCVDFADLLAVTLPYNRHHFESVYVITSKDDVGTQKYVDWLDNENARWLATDLFYARGAKFNKWAALEWGLDQIGRHGWLTLLDADVLWPKDVKVYEAMGGVGLVGGDGNERVLTIQHKGSELHLRRGQLCSPLRRMCSIHEGLQAVNEPSSEQWWNRFPIHRNVNEWAGYSQIFHASDPVLGDPPWHETNWEHAGGADSMFQNKWPRERKVRPPFEVLHLGEAGVNWYGRSSPLLDGTAPAEAAERRRRCAAIWAGRRARRAAGADPYGGERLPRERP